MGLVVVPPPPLQPHITVFSAPPSLHAQNRPSPGVPQGFSTSEQLRVPTGFGFFLVLSFPFCTVGPEVKVGSMPDPALWMAEFILEGSILGPACFAAEPTLGAIIKLEKASARNSSVVL